MKQREETVVFFVDRSLGRIDVPNALKEAGYCCEVHDDHFAPATEDSEWLSEVAARQWVVLTKDERIRYRPLELRALRAAHLRAFVVVCGNVRGMETAAILVKAMPRILRIVRKRMGPFIYGVYKDSTIKPSH